MVIRLEEKDVLPSPARYTRRDMITLFERIVEQLKEGDKAIIDLDEQRTKRMKLRGEKWPLFLRYLRDVGEIGLAADLEDVAKADFNMKRFLLRLIAPPVLAGYLQLNKGKIESRLAKFFNVPEFRVIVGEERAA